METKKASRSTFSIFYYLNRGRANDKGEQPIYVRFTVNGTKGTMSIQRFIHPKHWSETGHPLGNSAAIGELRSYMTEISAKLIKCHKVLKEDNKNVTADMLREAFTHGTAKKKSEALFFDLFNEFIGKQEQLMGKDVSKLTVDRYKLVKRMFEKFIETMNYTKDNFLVRHLNTVVIKDFEHFLKAEINSGHNNAMKYLQRLKKVITYCADRKLLEENPYENVKISMRKTERGYLNEDELQTIINKNFGADRLNVVRDMFVFNCFTGLAYIDSKNLTRSNIEAAPDGTLWIRTRRQKNDNRSNVPLLPMAMSIIKKYADLDKIDPNKNLLPLCSNQKMNEYLKEIATICKIDKNLTTHLARHTFATTVTLTNGVPIETVSKMLGHNNIKTTQIYAKIVDSKVGADMAALTQKLTISNTFGTIG